MSTVNPVQQTRRESNISYQKLRVFIGITGIFLPILAVIGCFVFGAGAYSWQISISHYFYSVMHIAFVAVLCMLGGFLVTYQGGGPWESRLSNLAGYCAIGVAAFPTPAKGFLPEKDPTNLYLQIKNYEVTKFWGNMHLVFAAVLLICFMIFCFYFFQEPDEQYTGTELRKFRRRKVIYHVCGAIIALSLVLLYVFFRKDVQSGLFRYSTFIFETTALWAFGVAWLVKGSEALKDLPLIKNMIQPIR